MSSACSCGLANYTQERSVNHRGAQLLRTSTSAGRSGKR
jgi:hypothetical protein